MPFGKGGRKLFRALGFLLIGAALLCLLLPIWFPWALRPLAKEAGAHFDSYERLGYSRFALNGLVLTNDSLVLHIRHCDAFIPSVWLWKLTIGGNPESNPFLRIENWDCELLPSRETNSASLFVQVQDAVRTLDDVGHWVPRATLSQGALHTGKTRFAIPEAILAKGQVQASVQLPPEASGETLHLKLTPASPFDLQIASSALGLESKVAVATNRFGLDVQSSTTWQSNRVELLAHFGRAGILPETASLRAQDFRIPGPLAKLAPYKELDGSLVIEWARGRFALDLTAAVPPVAAQTNLPPVDITLKANGDTNSATIEKLAIHLPFAEATLSNPTSFTFEAPYLRSGAVLALKADLARQQWVSLTGNITGMVQVIQSADKTPVANLDLTGYDLGSLSLKASKADVSASLHWPFLEVTRAEVRFDENSTATLSGKMDLEKNSVSDGHFQLRGPYVRRWLPEGYSLGTVSASGNFEGPVDNLVHSGRLEADAVLAPRFRPFVLSARWNGQARALRHFEIQLSNTNSSIAMEGSLGVEPRGSELELTSLSLATNRAVALKLASPVKARFTLPKPKAGWGLDLTPFHWTGPAGDLVAQGFVQWPNEGGMRLSAQGVRPDLLTNFTKIALPNAVVTHLLATANWTNGPASLSVDFSGTGSAVRTDRTEQRVSPGLKAVEILSIPLDLQLKLQGDAHGMVLSNLVVNSPTSTVIVAHGFLPLTFTPGNITNGLNIDPKEPLVLSASVKPQAFLWENLAALVGAQVAEPNLTVDLTGTWNKPQGQVVFRSKKIALKQERFKQLEIEDVSFSVVLDREKARLSEGQFLVQGQPIHFAGELPLGRVSWTELSQRKPPDWSRASAQVTVKDAKLAAFEPLFPQILAPQGEFELDIKLLPGLKLEGALNLRHARTRPLGNTAPVRDINVTLKFHDKLLALENASANLSGAEIELTGQVDLHGTNWLGGALPPFELTLRGTNVPLSREPDYIIRSDLDLKIAKTNDAPAVVLGNAHLRDSFYLSDLSALIPGGIAKPSARPPYFSIDNPTLADWRLAVTVDGGRWLKVRASLFNGEVSSNLRLQGTLKDPVALGDLRIDSGIVRFPFGNLEVQQGLITLSSQNPYHPEISVRATSKQFGYDIRMEVNGAVDAPVIQFTSNPSLSSEQILLMLTAGQLPQGTYTLTPQQRAQTVALFLGRDLLSKLGLSDQTQERLTIRSGEEISEQGRPTYHVEYRLTPRWFIVGEYDRFGDFNAGFKWRIYSK